MSNPLAWLIVSFGHPLDDFFGVTFFPSDLCWVVEHLFPSSFPKSLQQISLTLLDQFGPPLASYLHHAVVGGQNSGNYFGSLAKSPQHYGLDLTFPATISVYQNPPSLHVFVSTGTAEVMVSFNSLVINY